MAAVTERVIRAAGGVLWRTHHGGVEVALVHRPRYDDWSLPKGKAAPGEHPLTTARREVGEETGVSAVIGPRLPSQRYRSPGGPKVVHFWAVSGPDAPFRPTAEVDELAWLPVRHARRVLTYPRDVTVLDAFTHVARVDAVALLVRPASTGGTPTLDGRGVRQARALSAVLPGFAPHRLVCDPHLVCRDTLTPLATRLRLTVAAQPDLDHRHGTGRPAASQHWIRQEAGEGGPLVACVRGRVIREVISGLARDSRAVPARIRARKASVWALFFHGYRLAAADYYPYLNVPGW